MLHCGTNECGNTKFLSKLLNVKISGMILSPTITTKTFKTICAFKEKVECLFRINFLHLHNSEYNVLYCGLGVCIKCTGQAICAMPNMHCSSKERICSQIFKLVNQIHINICEGAHKVTHELCCKYNS